MGQQQGERDGDAAVECRCDDLAAENKRLRARLQSKERENRALIERNRELASDLDSVAAIASRHQSASTNSS